MMAKPRTPIDMKVIAERAPEDAEVSELVSRLEAEADREIAASAVTLRWGKAQIAVVKRAAAILGVPYQTYIAGSLHKLVSGRLKEIAQQ